MDDFSPAELATVEKFMKKHYPYLTEIVRMGNEIGYGQSNITIRWHESKGTDVMRVTDFVRRKVKEGDYGSIVDDWIDSVGDGQMNVTFQIKGGKVVDVVNAVAYERKRF